MLRMWPWKILPADLLLGTWAGPFRTSSDDRNSVLNKNCYSSVDPNANHGEGVYGAVNVRLAALYRPAVNRMTSKWKDVVFRTSST